MKFGIQEEQSTGFLDIEFQWIPLQNDLHLNKHKKIASSK